MSALSPFGTARARFVRAAAEAPLYTDDEEQRDLAVLGWEVARCAPGLAPAERRALSALAAATLGAIRAGSTRVPLDARLGAALEAVGAGGELAPARALLARAASGAAADAVAGVIGRPGDRTPLVVEGDYLYAERMRALDERFCARAVERLARPSSVDARAAARALEAVADGPPPLTDEQRQAVRAALTAPLALVTGGPGTGKTTIVVALLRALAWTGVPMESVAVAAPTGKAAQRLQQAIDAGLAAWQGDLADAALRASAPVPQTLHRLLGWSPSRGRFARHENDPLPHAVVLVDEASMVDLAMMDRLLRAARPAARVVLLGDADQLPSIEAGAVFRDLCAALDAVRLTANLRVAREPSARGIVEAARAVNAGATGEALGASLVTRASVDAVTFEGVEHLAAPWSEVGEALLERWWTERVAADPELGRRAGRRYRLREGAIDPAGDDDLRALFDAYGRARLLCVTRVRGTGAGAEELGERLVDRLRGGAGRTRRRRAPILAPGTPVLVERNDYERQLWNGDQGLVVRTQGDDGGDAGLAAVFARRAGYEAFPLDTMGELAPAFAMTVHRAQGSEFDHVALVLPETDLPLLTRELVYTAITRARRSVLLVGDPGLLARAVARPVERYSGVAERLGKRPR